MPGPGELAQSTLTSSTPTLFCTPDGRCTPAVDLRPSRNLVSDPSGHPVVGRPEAADIWLRQNPDVAAIDGRQAHRLFMTIAQFPAMRSSWLREIVGGSPSEVSRHLKQFIETGLVAVFDGAALPVGTGNEAGSQYEPGAAVGATEPATGPTWTAGTGSMSRPTTTEWAGTRRSWRSPA